MMDRGQVWYTDFAIGLLIFMIVIIGYFTVAYAESIEDDGNLGEIIGDAKSIASALVSEGHPVSWNQSNVTRLGLTDGKHHIVQSKVDMFNNFTYEDRGDAMGTSKEYYFYFEHPNGTRFNILGINGSNAKQLVQVTRIVEYNTTFVKMVFHLWAP